MTEELTQRAKGLQNLAEAIRLVYSIRTTNNELQRIYTSIKIQANEAEKLEFTDELTVCFKNAIAGLVNRVPHLESFGPKFAQIGEELESKAQGYIANETVTAEELKDFIGALQAALKLAEDFSAEFQEFKKELATAERASEDLMECIKQQVEETENKAASARRWGAGKSAGLAGAGAGLLAAGFFTGGATWVALALAATGGAAVGLAGSSMNSAVLDASELNALAQKLSDKAEGLKTVANELRSISDKSAKLTMIDTMVDALKEALAMCQRDYKRQQDLEDEKRKNAELQRRVEELERRQASLDAK